MAETNDPRSRFVWQEDDIEITSYPDEVEENFLPTDETPTEDD